MQLRQNQYRQISEEFPISFHYGDAQAMAEIPSAKVDLSKVKDSRSFSRSKWLRGGGGGGGGEEVTPAEASAAEGQLPGSSEEGKPPGGDKGASKSGAYAPFDSHVAGSQSSAMSGDEFEFSKYIPTNRYKTAKKKVQDESVKVGGGGGHQDGQADETTS